MIKNFKCITITELLQDHIKYLTMVETGETLYLIRNSRIVAKIQKVSFGGTVTNEPDLKAVIT